MSGDDFYEQFDIKIHNVTLNSLEFCSLGPNSGMHPGRKKSHLDMERALSSDPRGTFSRNPKNSQIYDSDEYQSTFNPVTKPTGKNLPKILEAIYFRRNPDVRSLSRPKKNMNDYLDGITDQQGKERGKNPSHQYLEKPNIIFIPDDLWSDEAVNVDLGSQQDEPNEHEKNEEKLSDAPHDHALDVSTIDTQNEPVEQTKVKTPTAATGAIGKKFKAKKNKKSGKNKSKNLKPVSKIVNLPQLFADSVAIGKSSDEPVDSAKTDTGPQAAKNDYDNQILPPEDIMTPGIDTVFNIRIYKPFDYTEFQNKPDRNSCHLLYHDMVVAGRHNLIDIKEEFICTKKNPDFQGKSNNGFFFIKNQFYVDNEGPATRQVESLRKLCLSRKLGDYPCHNMRATRMDELDIKLGNPDVYIHDEICEHIIVFSEIRLVNANDPVFMAQYPHTTPLYKYHKTPFCYNCAGLDPRWIVAGCLRIPFNKALFCQDCLKNLLYGNDGKVKVKISDFKAYPCKDGDDVKPRNQ